jgi:SAM-dependent methyltransferase
MHLENLTGALRNIFAGIGGFCNVCGRPTYFVCVDPATARNNVFCLFCKSCSRKRHITNVLLRAVFPQARHLRQIPHDTTVRVLNASLCDAYSRLLPQHPAFTLCDLLPDVPPGTQLAQNRFCQDLQALTFGDATFDVVITEDVLEHVRRAPLAFSEIHRVLRPGGVHLFTVPFYFDRDTLNRVDVSGDEDVHIVWPPEYHGDSLRSTGILAYRTFGLDLLTMLTSIGFETTIERCNYADFRHGIVDSFVFVSRKCQ